MHTRFGYKRIVILGQQFVNIQVCSVVADFRCEKHTGETVNGVRRVGGVPDMREAVKRHTHARQTISVSVVNVLMASDTCVSMLVSCIVSLQSSVNLESFHRTIPIPIHSLFFT